MGALGCPVFHLAEMVARALEAAMIDEDKVEALKVWYSIFSAIIDCKESQDWKLAKLILLRAHIRKAAPGLEPN